MNKDSVKLISAFKQKFKSRLITASFFTTGFILLLVFVVYKIAEVGFKSDLDSYIILPMLAFFFLFPVVLGISVMIGLILEMRYINQGGKPIRAKVEIVKIIQFETGTRIVVRNLETYKKFRVRLIGEYSKNDVLDILYLPYSKEAIKIDKKDINNMDI